MKYVLISAIVLASVLLNVPRSKRDVCAEWIANRPMGHNAKGQYFDQKTWKQLGFDFKLDYYSYERLTRYCKYYQS